ncbi:hypothetical protein AB3X52_11090 [Nocardioides sp. DS6]|uniref:Cholesterol esterase n=1 Tax=Nocardioides eburneus TaxID=3231482 RepID=A0ABV3SYZ4_9ACTN
MGRTRLGRFAAITVPAAVVSAGLGVAIVQGMVSATIASADDFSLSASSISASGLAVRPGFAGAGASTDDSKSSVVAEVSGAKAPDLGLELTKSLPVLGSLDLNVCLASGSTNFDLGSVTLNAADLNATGADSAIADVKVGTTQSAAGMTADSDTGYDADGFALTGGAATLNGLNAAAYSATLPDGLSGLSGLGIHTAFGAKGSAQAC